jgi:hypothetical protein
MRYVSLPASACSREAVQVLSGSACSILISASVYAPGGAPVLDRRLHPQSAVEQRISERRGPLQMVYTLLERIDTLVQGQRPPLP